MQTNVISNFPLSLTQALSCSDALVRMQPPDISQRVEQIQLEYVDLTNLLVRRIDDMHQQWKRDVAKSPPSTKVQTDVDKFGLVQNFQTPLKLMTCLII